MRINVTETAVERLLGSGANTLNFLRLGVQPGGCAGMSYTAVLDTNLSEHDEVVFEQGDLRIVAAREVFEYLDGLEVDFSDDLIQPGLLLKNPNAASSCGCGSSFAATPMDDCSTCGGCGG